MGVGLVVKAEEEVDVEATWEDGATWEDDWAFQYEEVGGDDDVQRAS